jgi:hypothetical protein
MTNPNNYYSFAVIASIFTKTRRGPRYKVVVQQPITPTSTPNPFINSHHRHTYHQLQGEL